MQQILHIVTPWDQIYELVASKYVLGIVLLRVISKYKSVAQIIFVLIRIGDLSVMLLKEGDLIAIKCSICHTKFELHSL